MAAYLCCAGWLEVYRMRVSIYVGFRKIEMLAWVGFLWIVMSRQLILCSRSNSWVNCILGCMELNSFVIVLISVCEESNTIRISST